MANISLDTSLTARYPDTKIAFIHASVDVQPNHPYVEELKNNLQDILQRKGLTSATLSAHPDIARWRDVFREMGVKASDYPSSIESLCRRTLKGKGIGNVSSIVDLYNCTSISCLLPFGAYDIDKLEGDICIRYGQEGDLFSPLGAGETAIQVKKEHIVYADSNKVLCWLWNYRDSRLSSVSLATRQAIFFIDSAFTPNDCQIEKAMELLISHLEQTGSKVHNFGVLDASTMHVKT